MIADVICQPSDTGCQLSGDVHSRDAKLIKNSWFIPGIVTRHKEAKAV
ncbi:MAG: hypothetical protein GF392_03635 [Candidatus Omnitrophica bacterium]|nr:hypothetical protein [Candidatus Omnitrophota bacterium]